jgi:hypothetical protein
MYVTMASDENARTSGAAKRSTSMAVVTTAAGDDMLAPLIPGVSVIGLKFIP